MHVFLSIKQYKLRYYGANEDSGVYFTTNIREKHFCGKCEKSKK